MIIDIFINPAKKRSINNKIKLSFVLNFDFTNKNFEASKLISIPIRFNEYF